ncbi:OLC1v1001735C1 [Oldenlandia corymbosa var. corymbosa]|uniref:OLC1v1001735C1 n=1 Tax=Oldenlandia corymbosa var. corymbosa TaxID=529605 RepID=A0AAV1D5X8_OLDCO|nr:OLC1v1001735C1 [Oldenlandia corymbosa var. corymbosa]
MADGFLKKYYEHLHKTPEMLYGFFKEESVIRWDGVESSTTTTTIDGIREIIMSSDYKGCEVKVVKVDAQFSLMESVILTATGCSLEKDNVKRIISQTFFLAKQEIGWFLLNDNLHIIDTQEILNVSSSCFDGVSSPHESLKEAPITAKITDNVEETLEIANSIKETLEVIQIASKEPDTPNDTEKVEG